MDDDISVNSLARIGEDVRIRRSPEGRYSVTWHFNGASRVVSSETLTDAAFMALVCADVLKARAACEEVARG